MAFLVSDLWALQVTPSSIAIECHFEISDKLAHSCPTPRSLTNFVNDGQSFLGPIKQPALVAAAKPEDGL